MSGFVGLSGEMCLDLMDYVERCVWICWIERRDVPGFDGLCGEMCLHLKC